MKRILNILLVILLLIPLEFSLISIANATKTGSACKTVNAKGMDGKNPIVCKKNKSGKLVWTSAPKIKATQKATPTVVNFNGSGRLIMSQPKEGADTTPWVKTDASNCFALAIALGIRGQVQRPISSILLFSKTNKVEVRITDGNGSILGVAYPEWKYIDDNTCSFSFKTEVPYSNFYNFAIYTKYGRDYENPNLIKYSEIANENPYVFELFRY
jgi:hypothetical protein